MDEGKRYHLRPRDRSGSQDVTSANSSSATRTRRKVKFADSHDVDHEATRRNRRERSVTPYLRDVLTPETRIPTSVPTRKRRNVELDEDSPLATEGSDSIDTPTHNDEKQKPGTTHPPSTPTQIKVKAGKRRKVDDTNDMEGLLLPPTPLTDGHGRRRSMRIRERSIGPVTPLPPTPILAPVLPTPVKSSVRIVNPTSLFTSHRDRRINESTPEPSIDAALDRSLFPENTVQSTYSRTNVSEEKVPRSDSDDVSSGQQNDSPSILERADSPLIYQPVDHVALPQTPVLASEDRQAKSELSSPVKFAEDGGGDKTPFLASPVLFDMHLHLSGSRNLQSEELPPYARRLDYTRDSERTGGEHEGLSLLASAATSPPVQMVPSRQGGAAAGVSHSRPALADLGTPVTYPESAVREERPGATPIQSVEAVVPLNTDPSAVANRPRETIPQGLDMHKIAKNIYMGSYVPGIEEF